jgi:hypothetical protein
MGVAVPEVADPDGEISLSYQEFPHAVGRLSEVDFPIEREPAAAWEDFVGWRINYEQAGYAVAAASTPSRRCGRVHAPTAAPPSHPSARRLAARPSKPAALGQRRSWFKAPGMSPPGPGCRRGRRR